jgi:hypothetical protein
VFLSLREAARRSGLSKATIWRKIKSGELSVREKGEDGAFRIDASELTRFMDASRVQRAVASPETVGTPTHFTETPEKSTSPNCLAEALHACELAETRLADLKALLEQVKGERDRLLAQSDHWRAQAEQALRLLPSSPAVQPALAAQAEAPPRSRTAFARAWLWLRTTAAIYLFAGWSTTVH